MTCKKKPERSFTWTSDFLQEVSRIAREAVIPENEWMSAWSALKAVYGDRFETMVSWIRSDPLGQQVSPKINDVRLIARLERGEWQAKGFRVPASEPVDIPSDQWVFLKLDPNAETATGGGIEYVGLRFRETPAPAPRLTETYEKECKARLIDELARSRTRTKEKIEDDESKRAGYTGKAFDRVWRTAIKASTTHASWRKRGPVPRKSF